MKTPVYMDYHATTPVDPRVLEAMLPFFTESFGNPASRQHRFGWVAEEAVESSRSTIAGIVNARKNEIVFTGGATESNNLALKGIAESLRQKGNHIITVQTEHKSVLDTCKRLEKYGYEVTFLPVDESGMIDLHQFEAAFTQKTILVSVMAANNEIGVLQPLREVGEICRKHAVAFHTDATQAVGKIPLDVESMHIDLLSLSGHKIYGPKGIGALYIRSENPKITLAPQLDGGGQERGLRSGTLNVPGIAGLAKALDIATKELQTEPARLRTWRDKMLREFTGQLGDVVLNGHATDRLPNNLNVSFLHVEDNALMMSMKDIAVSTGSACSTADPQPSYVLKALKLPQERLHSAIRFGLGRFTTEEEVEYTISRVIESVKKLRQLSPAYRRKQESVISQH
ncbi:MAG TPA: IscS subfamily cysteine desulfurase [Bacteroidota bacterium]|nr:IscS subfamily cysteine desulfurase [Bacteroidota bacterium]